ncbi:MAG: prolyl oligopeptidase family serine peptidase [Ilumatobacteraceae bacterium]
MTGGHPDVVTPRGTDADVLHGVRVDDPYRWLEDGESADVQEWVTAQNVRTRSALDRLAGRADWHRRLVTMMGLPVVQAVQVRGERMIMLERAACAQQARLVLRVLGEPTANPVVLADPAAGVADAAVAIDWYAPSDDGMLVAFGVSEGGSENSELRVVRVDGAGLLDERIPNCRAGSVAWEPDASGFFYTRYPEGDQYHRTVHHHTLGADWRDDPVVWAEHPTPESWPSVALSPSGEWLLVTTSVGWGRSDLQVLERSTGEWYDVITGRDVVTELSFLDDHTLVGMTTFGASRGRVVRVALAGVAAGPAVWDEVVAERDVVIGGVRPAGDSLVVATSKAGVDAIERWAQDGSWSQAIEGVGTSTVAQLTGDRSTGSAFALITGFDQPAAVWRVGAHVVEQEHPAGQSDVPDLSVTHVEYPSLDGTMVGLFLVHRSDVDPGVTTPTILNGYGGFAITESPVWSPTIAVWCESGGLYAIAGLRGGFEHGESWHRAGRRANKQNVFDDFHAAADWLVEQGLTSREHLAIAGGSNGGLLVGAALTQRPDLCRAVWCAVPLLDMIRFPRFLIARLWTDEYGDPDLAEEFEWLIAYSPYHRVRDGVSYPAVLLTTAEGDSRVDALHARKMTAALQASAADQGERPVFLHQEGRAGHGQGKPVGKRADEQADVLAFLSWQLGHLAA